MNSDTGYNRLISFLSRHKDVFGYIYLLLIFGFAGLYMVPGCLYVPENLRSIPSYIRCIYFSTATITTLGFGDITPLNTFGTIAVSTEAVLGIFLIGFYLSIVSNDLSIRFSISESKKEEQKYRSEAKERLNIFVELVKPYVEAYKMSLVGLFSAEDTATSAQLEPEFSKLKNLHGPSLLVTDIGESKIETYYKREENLKGILIQGIGFVESNIYPEIVKHISVFINRCDSHGEKTAIRRVDKDPEMKRTIPGLFEEFGLEPELSDPALQGNIFMSYVIFYKSLVDKVEALDNIIAILSEARPGQK